jgi:hypothetical protein
MEEKPKANPPSCLGILTGAAALVAVIVFLTGKTGCPQIVAGLPHLSGNSVPTKSVNGVTLPYLPIQIVVSNSESFDFVSKMKEGNSSALNVSLQDKLISISGTLKNVSKDTSDYYPGKRMVGFIDSNALSSQDVNQPTYYVQFYTNDSKILNCKSGDVIVVQGKYKGTMFGGDSIRVEDCQVN